MEIEHDIIYGIRQADSLVNAGKPDEALSFYKKSLKAKDSLYNLLTTSQMEEILASYNIDKLILQKRAETQHVPLYLPNGLHHHHYSTAAFQYPHIPEPEASAKKDEKEMKRLTAIAEEANEIKSRFLANMSYNIRIPLNNVVGFSQLITDDTGLSEEEKREYSGIIQNNAAELIQLVNNVLDLSRLEANMMKFQLQDCNVQEWCSELACLIQMRSEGSIHLELEADAGDATIHTDINRFTQMVSNMLLYPIECKKEKRRKDEAGLQYGSSEHKLPDSEQPTCRSYIFFTKAIYIAKNLPPVL